MTWNSVAPDGNRSVKANEAVLQTNTTYIKDTMGGDDIGTNATTTNDHFWDVDADVDGHHRFVKLPGFVEGSPGSVADPNFTTGVDAVIYAKEASTSVGRYELFIRNTDAIYQVSPSVKTGTLANLDIIFLTLTDVPTDVYGEIFMYTTNTGGQNDRFRTCKGYFRSDGTIVNAWAQEVSYQGVSGYRAPPLEFGNGTNASGLNIRVAVDQAKSGETWSYIVTYRAL